MMGGKGGKFLPVGGMPLPPALRHRKDGLP